MIHDPLLLSSYSFEKYSELGETPSTNYDFQINNVQNFVKKVF